MWTTGGSYGAWAEFLERFASGETVDPSRLPALQAEDFPPDGWERFGRRLGEGVSGRLNLWAEGLNRGISEARDEFEVGRALASARIGLRTVRALARHPGLPAELRDRLLESVDGQVRKAQDELEAQVEQDRRRGARPQDVEARLRTLRDNRLTAVLLEDPGRPPGPAPAPGPLQASTPAAPWAVDPGTTPRRRLSFD